MNISDLTRLDLDELRALAAETNKRKGEIDRETKRISAAIRAKKRKTPVGVSDHAVLRYIERVMGIDVEVIRRSIAESVEGRVGAGRSNQLVEFETHSVAVSKGEMVSTILPAGEHLEAVG